MENRVLNFDEDVVETSHHTPVLVDFWAPWCGPCRVLGPTLDALAQDTEAWTLVKVNTETHPELAQRFGIRGIPAVKLFHRGQVVAEFTGALPAAAVKQWLGDNLPSEARSLVRQAQPLLDAGLLGEARALLEQAHEADPDLGEARTALARTLAFTDPDRAHALLAGPQGAGPEYGQVAEAIETLTTLRALQRDDALPEGPGREPLERALQHLDAGDFDGAAQAVLDALQADRYYADDAPRKLGVALFTLLGPGHDVTRAHRRRFSMLLY